MTIAGDFTDLVGENVLIVEDDWYLANDMAKAVRQAGGMALGPVPDVKGAMAIVETNRVDSAVLDIRLGEENSFSVAATLKSKGVRIVFVSSYDDWIMPNDLDDVPIYQKSVDPDNVIRLLFEPKAEKAG